MKTYTVELTEEFIKEAYAVACNDWKTKIKKLVPDAFKVEAGKWYKYNNRVFFITEFDEEGHAHGYGINPSGEWLDARDINRDICIINSLFVNDLKPATHQEVEEMLIKEAKKRGLVKYSSFKSPWINHCNNVIKSKETKECDIVYDSNEDELTLENSEDIFTIFKDGKWATPIEDETLLKIQELENELKKLKNEYRKN